MTIKPGTLRFLHVREMHPRPSLDTLRRMIVREARELKASAIVLAPFYKLQPGLDENNTAHATELLTFFESLEAATGASIVYAQHFSKGNQSGKRSIDRISGTGVFSRDPDALLTFTAHKQEDAYVVEATLRAHKPVEPFVVRWQWPLMRLAEGLDPSDLQQAKGGRPSKYTPEMLLDVLGKRSLTTKEWCRAVMEKTGMSKTTFHDLKRGLEKAGAVTETRAGRWKRAK